MNEQTAFIDAWLTAWSNGDAAKLLAFYHPEARYRDPACPKGLNGHEALGEYFAKLLAAYPDWRWTRQELFPAQAGLTLRWRLDWAESWRPVTMGLDWLELKDGLISRHEVYFDASHWPELGWTWQQASDDGTHFEVSTDKQRLNRDRLLQMLRDTYWAPELTPEQLNSRIESSVCFGLYHQKALIGFARALSDGHSIAYLADVIVAPEYRGQGLGYWLTECALNHPELQPMRRWLLRTRDAHGLYQKLGFEPLRDLGGWLEKWAEARP